MVLAKFVEAIHGGHRIQESFCKLIFTTILIKRHLAYDQKSGKLCFLYACFLRLTLAKASSQLPLYAKLNAFQHIFVVKYVL